MRRQIKPIVVVVFFALFGLILVISKVHSDNLQKQQRATVKRPMSVASSGTYKNTTSLSKTNTDITLKPIIDISGWQLPSEINYDLLSKNISGAIVRVYGGSQVKKDNNASYSSGIDKSFKKHIEEFQKRHVPVAVYSYAQGKNSKEMKKEAKIFYENASPYHPTFYWIDVEEATMSNMNKGVQVFLKELRSLGAKNVGLYIGTYFMNEQNISIKGFDAIWIPTYGPDNGYYNAAPQTNLEYDLHQYTSQGSLNGFDSPLDLNQISVTKDVEKTYNKLFGTTNQ